MQFKIRKYGPVCWLFIILLQFNKIAFGAPGLKTSFTPPSASRLGKYQTAAVVSDGVPCSDVGRDVLLDGGNAVDAAVATVFCVGIANPQSTGIGGGSLMTIYDAKTRIARSLLAREVAPIAANMFGGNSTLSQRGPLAVAVPGELAGSWAVHQQYGKLPWSRLISPSIDLAENGLAVNSALAAALRSSSSIILAEPSMSDFVNPATGKVYQEGDILTRPTLANTLKEIAANGVDAFYKGSIADKIVADLQRRGSIISKEDLLQYSADWVEPVKMELKGGLTLYSIPPPGSGAVMGYIVNILDSYNLRKGAKVDVADDPLTYHRITEAFKHAFAQRTKLGDPRFVPEVNELAKNLTSLAWALDARSKINDSFTSNDPEYYGAVVYTPEDRGTSHVSVLDGDGMGVSITSTINLYFGAKFASEQTGIIFNNEMDDFGSPNITNGFAVPPSPANFIVPGKRPLSSMVPTVIVNESTGRVRFVIGASGGTRITTATAYTIIRNLWFGEDIKQAIDSYRIHHQLLPMNLRYQSGFPTTITQNLAAKGHNLTLDTSESCVMGIAVEADGMIYANSDYRKAGDVAGIDPVSL